MKTFGLLVLIAGIMAILQSTGYPFLSGVAAVIPVKIIMGLILANSYETMHSTMNGMILGQSVVLVLLVSLRLLH